MKIELTPDAKPVKVRLRKYSQEQKEFLKNFVDDLVNRGLAYPTSIWGAESLVIPQPRAKFRFTVDLRPVNKFTVKHQYSMPNLEHELTKLSIAKVFCHVRFITWILANPIGQIFSISPIFYNP